MYFRKDINDTLNNTLNTLVATTPVTSVSPGSVARSIIEILVKEVNDFFDILDHNMAMSFISTAAGPALDLLGSLFNCKRKTVTDLATLDAKTASFAFYIDKPFYADITIPAGTRVFPDALENNYVSQFVVFITLSDVIIPAGHLRVFASIRPSIDAPTVAVGTGTLTRHDATQPIGTFVKCNNLKPIPPFATLETDENYRARLVVEARKAGGGTGEAIRFAALSTPGVRDVLVREGIYGLATAEVCVVLERQDTDRAAIFALASKNIETVRPIGCRLFITQPTLQTVDMRVVLIVQNKTGLNLTGLSDAVKTNILIYLNSLSVESPLVYAQLLQRIFEISFSISDISIDRFQVNGIPVRNANFTPDKGVQLVPGNISVQVAQ